MREDCVGDRRGRRPGAVREEVWDNSAAATTRVGMVGPPQAGHGPLESSGRFALHGHWRWWLRAFGYQRMVELCKQEPHLLEVRLKEMTTAAITSIMSVQGQEGAAENVAHCKALRTTCHDIVMLSCRVPCKAPSVHLDFARS